MQQSATTTPCHTTTSATNSSSPHLTPYRLSYDPSPCQAALATTPLEKIFLDVDVGLLRETSTDSGACACVVVVEPHRVVCANAGDTRALLWVGEPLLVSEIHKPNSQKEQQRIEACGAFVTPNGRVFGQLAVSRSFGDRSLKRTSEELTQGSAVSSYLTDPVKAPTCLTALPGVFQRPRDGKEDFLLASSDGLFDEMEHTEGMQFVHNKLQQLARRPTPQDLNVRCDVSRGVTCHA